jgi:hypothetical protein
MTLDDEELKRLRKSFAVSEGSQYWNNKAVKLIQRNAKKRRAAGHRVGGKKKSIIL